MKQPIEKDNYYAKPLSYEFTYYLSDEVTEAGDYTELYELLYNAAENDVVRIVINNYGGSLTSCVAICNAIRNCKALTVGVLTSVAYSAAGAIWLACEGQEVHSHVGFMGHNAIGGSYGSLHQQRQRLDHECEILRSLYLDVYDGFCTEAEIEGMLRNDDLWLNESQIVERLTFRDAYLKDKQQAAMQSAMDEAMSEFMEDEVPVEILNKLTKPQLVKYASGSLDIKIAEDGTFTLVDIENKP